RCDHFEDLTGRSFYNLLILFSAQVAYVVALLGYMIKEARNLYKQKCQYFKDIWNFVEVFIMVGSFAAIAAYAYMIFATKKAIAEFSRTHGNVFMNFQFLAYWNEVLTYLLAVICFFATLKLVRLFRFNRRIGLLGSVLRYAAHDLKYFMIIFFLLFIAFVLVFYLLYEGTLADFRSFLGSVETSLQIILGKFDFTSMYERELVLGPLMFAVFTLCIIFIVVSMFVAILEESFGKVMQDIRLQSDDHEITQFILAQLIAWTGLNRTGWGKKLMGPIDTAQEPEYQEHSERELSHKLTELNRLMDEFLGYVQLNYLADLDTKSKKPVAYVVALLGYMIKEARNLYKQKCQYFKDIWNFVEVFIMVGSFAAIAAYAYMIFATKKAIAEFSRTHGNVFMNFQFLAYWNEVLTYLLAVICFFATLKLVRLFRFNRRIGLLGSVLRYAAHDLKYFMIIFFLLFIAFVLVFYLLYEGTLADFRSFLGSVETSLQIILGKFDFTSMYERELVLGPLMFAVFTLCIIFIVVSMFVAILEESFGKVMQDIRLQSDDHEITQFILAQLIAWTGLNRTGWGKKLMGPIDTAQEPEYQEHSERELSHKLTELNRLMDEFLGYVQLNYLADLDTKSKKPVTQT
ncbi:hypothetical protein AHF37_11707, partial [Paragonimus kellicotti]